MNEHKVNKEPESFVYGQKGMKEDDKAKRESKVANTTNAENDMTEADCGMVQEGPVTDYERSVTEIKKKIIRLEKLYPENLVKLGQTWKLGDKVLSNQEEELSYLRIEAINLQAMIFKNISMKAVNISEIIRKMIIQIEEEWSAIRKARFHSTVEGCLVMANKMCTKISFKDVVNDKDKFRELSNKLMDELSASKEEMLECDLKFSAKLRYKWINKLEI